MVVGCNYKSENSELITFNLKLDDHHKESQQLERRKQK